MKKTLYLAAFLAALNFGAMAEDFTIGKHSYLQAVTPGPISVTNSGSYGVSQDFVVNHNLTVANNSILTVGGNLFINAPFSIQNNAKVNVGGDVIVKNAVDLQNSSQLIVGGKVYVVNKQGSIKSATTSEVDAKVENVNDYPGSPLAATLTNKSVAQPVRVVNSPNGQVVQTPAGTIVNQH